MRNKLIYYSPIANMGETSETDAEKFRDWALKELKNKFPGFNIEVSDRENTSSFWTNIDDIQMNDRIEMIIHNLGVVPALLQPCPTFIIEGKDSQTLHRHGGKKRIC